jgi:uncharacterized lipoprotein YajG
MGFMIAAVAFKIAGIFHKNDARLAREKAKRFREAIGRIQNRQKRRAFLRQFRSAQAAQVAGRGARAGGLESSAFQGQVSSLLTQARFGVFEQELQAKFAVRASAADSRAAKKEFRASIADAGASIAAGAATNQEITTTDVSVDTSGGGGFALPGFDEVGGNT